MNYKVYNSDCIIGMQELQNETVDAIITDPPYNIARANNFKSMGRAGIDFGEWDKGFNIVSWLPIAIDKIKKRWKHNYFYRLEKYNTYYRGTRKEQL